MPTIELSYTELCDLLGGGYTIDELRDKIPMLGVDMESISEEKIVVEVFPNRPDMLSVEGFARALKGFLDIETGLVEYKIHDSGAVLFVDGSVEDVRPYIACGIIKGVKFDEGSLVSLMDLQEKLHVTHGRNRKKVAIGVHDMNNSGIKPPFKYLAARPEDISFVPLDMSEELNLTEILRKHPKGVEFAHVLEGFDRCPVILDAEERVLSFPPIINGELTRVTGDTKDLFIEVTGNDKRAVEQALNIVVTSIADRGGEIYGVGLEHN